MRLSQGYFELIDRLALCVMLSLYKSFRKKISNFARAKLKTQNLF
jgi:hypothetical protein